ncbi:uncharacterized protein LOC100908791 [Galendromus occidentalis]|uniref:Uncharacterized protein LOC100908791 n=1 Tax=Galendromus occidentalis TaxID=34638 RepID=A0AAJ6QRY3_9ACAR|nr:uncharacterized protein LOC100908791 [Galendromus occidentalis]
MHPSDASCGFRAVPVYAPTTMHIEEPENQRNNKWKRKLVVFLICVLLVASPFLVLLVRHFRTCQTEAPKGALADSKRLNGTAEPDVKICFVQSPNGTLVPGDCPVHLVGAISDLNSKINFQKPEAGTTGSAEEQPPGMPAPLP